MHTDIQPKGRPFKKSYATGMSQDFSRRSKVISATVFCARKSIGGMRSEAVFYKSRQKKTMHKDRYSGLYKDTISACMKVRNYVLLVTGASNGGKLRCHDHRLYPCSVLFFHFFR